MTDSDAVPAPAVRRPRRWSPNLIWLVPLIAALAGLSLVMRSYLGAGPSITITFKTAEGLDAGKTEVKFRDVVVGRLRGVRLSKDHTYVIASVDLTGDAEGMAVEDTRFWVVRPRIDMGGVSGLGTLISGSYIGIDGGKSKTKRKNFEGLETPPDVTSDREGKRYVLTAADLGSLSIGSPVYFRRIPVGRIVGYKLAADGKSVSLQAYVDAPNDRLVTNDTRFWNASGVDVSVKPSGLTVTAQSIATILAGGIAFLAPDDVVNSPVAADGAAFKLYQTAIEAFAPPDGEPLRLRMRFAQSTRGLVTGAPVDFRGTVLGSVKSIVPLYDMQSKTFGTEVTAIIYPTHFGNAYDQLRAAAGGDAATPATVFAGMIETGLRAQLKSGNLITGQLYIALDYPPKVKPVGPVAATDPLDMPTMPGSLEEIQAQIADIVRKVDEIPFGDIGRNARDTLSSANSLLLKLDTQLAPEAKNTLVELRSTLSSARGALSEDSPLQGDLHQTMTELDRAARSLRGLADYLQRHPESLLRGKPDNADPEPPLLPPDQLPEAKP